MLTEEQIIFKCKQNDRKAQKMLYDKYASVMLGICMRYVKERAEAEDVMQDGFLKIFLKINQYSGKGSFEGWMKRVMVNTALSNYRKNLKHYNHLDVDEVNDLNLQDGTYTDAEYTKEELFNIIKELPDGYRVVFNLFAIEGYKHKEIGEMLKIDVATSKSQFSRARKLIQKKLLKLEPTETVVLK